MFSLAEQSFGGLAQFDSDDDALWSLLLARREIIGLKLCGARSNRLDRLRLRKRRGKHLEGTRPPRHNLALHQIPDGVNLNLRHSVFQDEGNFHRHAVLGDFAIFDYHIQLFDPGASNVFQRLTSALDSFVNGVIKAFSR